MNLTKKFLIAIAAVVLGLIFLLGAGGVQFSRKPVSAASKVQAHFFWGDGCPYCEKEKEFWQVYLESNSDKVDLHSYEVYNNADNLALMKKVRDSLGVESSGVPFLVIGDEVVLGFSEEATVPRIEGLIEECLENTCDDAVLGVQDSDGSDGSISEAPSDDGGTDGAAGSESADDVEQPSDTNEEDQQNDEDSDEEVDYVESNNLGLVSIIFGIAMIITLLVVGGSLVFLLGNSAGGDATDTKTKKNTKTRTSQK